MIVSSPVEPGYQITQFSIKVVKQLLNGFNQLLKVPLSLQMDFGVVQNEVGPVRVLDLSKNLLFVISENIALNINGENT